MVGEKSIDHMALGFGMFDFAEQGREGKGRGEHTHTPGGVAGEAPRNLGKGRRRSPSSSPTLASSRERDEGVCVSVWAGGGKASSGEIKRRPVRCPKWKRNAEALGSSQMAGFYPIGSSLEGCQYI